MPLFAANAVCRTTRQPLFAPNLAGCTARQLCPLANQTPGLASWPIPL